VPAAHSAKRTTVAVRYGAAGAPAATAVPAAIARTKAVPMSPPAFWIVGGSGGSASTCSGLSGGCSAR
jgi:hypothetical protein